MDTLSPPGTSAPTRVRPPDPYPLLPPQSVDAEKGLLSSFLIAPRDIGGLCVSRRIAAEHFFAPAHATIYDVLLGMWDRSEPIDCITLTQFLRDRAQLDACGGSAFVADLFTFLPTAANALYYIDILDEKRIAREIARVAAEFGSRSHEEQDDVHALLDDFEQRALAIRRSAAAKLKSAKELAIDSIGRIEELYERRGAITGLATGLADLDRMTNGLHGSEMIVLAARPSMGKTALAMNLVEHIALDLRRPVAVFSLEMSAGQLMDRLLCSRARVNIKRVQDGFLSERDFPALQAAAARIAEARLFIDDESSLTIRELRARARRLKQQHDIEAVFIDYIQLMRSGTRRGERDRQLEVSEISTGLKALAKELHVPVVVLAQLNRNPEKRTGDSRGRPQLADLRESGSIEQDADLVALLVREEYYAIGEEEQEAARGKATLIIAKQRNGPTGDIPLTFIKEYTRFETHAAESAH